MKKLLLTSLLAAAVAVPVAAQQNATDPAAADLTAGEIRKVDMESKKVTIKHGAIKSLDMPPMTMVFQVKDAALLKLVKPGDKISFAAEKTAAGAYVVTHIKPAK